MQKTESLKVGILIVAYNAVSTLIQVLNRIPAHVWRDVEEVVVFDDASQDNTYELAMQYKTMRNEAKLTVFRNEANLGYGGNQKIGYQYLMGRGIDVAVLLHGDGQYAPEILDHLYNPILRGEADAVFGSRMMKEFGGPLEGGMPLYKYVGNRILSFFENRALNLNLTEFHSGYRAYNLNVLAQVDLRQTTNDFHFDTEIIIKLHHQDFQIKEVPIPTYYGDEICYVNGMKYARDVMRAVLRYKLTLRAIRVYDEFAEYVEHYPLKRARHSSHDMFRNMLTSGETVLDLGAGEGYFAADVQDKNNAIIGVDLLLEPVHKEAFGQYFRADLNQGIREVLHEIGDHQFDKVLMQDVLEHLYQPERLMQDVHRALKPDGVLIISVPNVANITVRLALLIGRFNYSERGILDKTHLRFFTRASARRFIESQGFRILGSDVTNMPFEMVLGLQPDRLPARLLNPVLRLMTRVMPGLFGYQLVFTARSVLAPQLAQAQDSVEMQVRETVNRITETPRP